MSIKELYNNKNGNTRAIIRVINFNEDIKTSFIEETSYLPNDISILERYYCWLNNITVIPTCKYCGNRLKFCDMKNGYYETCGSKECQIKAKTDAFNKTDWNQVVKTRFSNNDKCEIYQKRNDLTSQRKLNVIINHLSEMNYTYISSFKNNNIEYMKIQCNVCNRVFDIRRSDINRFYRTNKYNFCQCKHQMNAIEDAKENIFNWLKKSGVSVERDYKGLLFSDFYIYDYNMYIDIFNDKNENKRKLAEDKIIYFEINDDITKDELYTLIQLVHNIINNESPTQYSYYELQDEYEYYKNYRSVGDITLQNLYNHRFNIVKHYQGSEFYKEEMKIFLYNPTKRLKLYKKIHMLRNKNTNELHPSTIFSSFKISSIYYGYSHFYPQWTNWFINRYNISSVYDPCGGWGHHFLGMLQCDKIIYNDFNKVVCDNVQRIKNNFNITQLEIHNEDGRTFVPDDVDAWFMCPPYYNLETYNDKTFKNIDDYKKFLNDIFTLWKNSSSRIFGIVLREDYIKLIDSSFVEQYDLKLYKNPFSYEDEKRYTEKFYIFKK